MESRAAVVILFALPEESSPFIRRLRRRRPGGNPLAQSLFSSNSKSQDYPLEVHCSGAGTAAAARSACAALESQPTSLLVICGFAGGLDSSMNPGALILADRVLNCVSGEILEPPVSLVAVAASVQPLSGILVHKGSLATTDRVLVRASEKQDFGRRYEALAVDMETAGAAAAAEAAGVPWISVRAITDGCNDDMPLDFNALSGPDGAVDRRKILRAVLARPGAVPGLIRLGARSSRAAANLAIYLDALTSLPIYSLLSKDCSLPKDSLSA